MSVATLSLSPLSTSSPNYFPQGRGHYFWHQTVYLLEIQILLWVLFCSLWGEISSAMENTTASPKGLASIQTSPFGQNQHRPFIKLKGSYWRWQLNWISSHCTWTSHTSNGLIGNEELNLGILNLHLNSWPAFLELAVFSLCSVGWLVYHSRHPVSHITMRLD